MYINIEPVTVDNHKNGNFYNEMRECVCMSHMTQPGSTTSIPYPFVLPTILDSLSYYAITSPSKYIPFLYIPNLVIQKPRSLPGQIAPSVIGSPTK